MKQDVIYAARLFLRRPGLFVLTVAGMAVAIGVSTAVYSLVKGMEFAGYGIQAPESVFRVALTSGVSSQVTGNSPFQGNWAFAEYSRLREAASSADLVASVTTAAQYRAKADADEPQAISVMAVSDNYFAVLGLRAAVGRIRTSADARPVALLIQM